MDHDDVMKWKHLRVSGSLWGEPQGHLSIPLTQASDAELWYRIWSVPEQTVERKARDLSRHPLIMTSL